MMMKYIWLDDNISIKDQVPSEFQSIRIVLNPFLRMPTEWDINVNGYQYPSSSDILEFGLPIKWKNMIDRVEFDNYSELCIGLKTAILALNSTYQRTDLSEILINKMDKNEFFPQEDKISEFILRDIFNFFIEKGIKHLNYHMPLEDVEGSIVLNEEQLCQICDVYNSEIIIFDENCEYVFMSVYDSFITLFLSKNKNEIQTDQFKKWEIVNCDEKTKINWYLREVE